MKYLFEGNYSIYMEVTFAIQKETLEKELIESK